MFSRSGNPTRLLRIMPMFGKRRNQRWLTLTGSWNGITYISAFVHDINEIPTAVPMFSTSGNTIWLLRRMLDVLKREKSKMAAKRTDKFDYWSIFGTARGFIWRPFEGCKYNTTYLLCLVHLLSSFCWPYYQYLTRLFDFVNGLPICRTVFALMSTCSWLPTNCIELAVTLLYLSHCIELAV